MFVRNIWPSVFYTHPANFFCVQGYPPHLRARYLRCLIRTARYPKLERHAAQIRMAYQYFLAHLQVFWPFLSVFWPIYQYLFAKSPIECQSSCVRCVPSKKLSRCVPSKKNFCIPMCPTGHTK